MSQLARYIGSEAVPVHAEIVPNDPIALDLERMQVYQEILQLIPRQYLTQQVEHEVAEALANNQEAELIELVQQLGQPIQTTAHANANQYFQPTNTNHYSPTVVVPVMIDNSTKGSDQGWLGWFLGGVALIAIAHAASSR